MSRALRILLMSALVVSACGSTDRAVVAPGTSPGQSPTSSATPSSPPSGMLVLLVRRGVGPQRDMTVELVDLKRHVAAKADFSAPPSPRIPGCASVVPPPVRVAAGAAYFADSTGVIHRLDPSGATSPVASFKLTSSQQFLSYAVSPDGKKLIGIIFSTPPLRNPLPEFPNDPYIAGGHWTLDLETAIEGGATTLMLHKDFGTSYPTTGPTLITGWDDFGPTATLGSLYCIQQQIPSAEYAGASLIHLGLDGTHLDQVGGSGCIPWDELSDGTVLCGGSDWSSFSVRTRNGSVLWTRKVGCCIVEPRLSPDGSGVTANGELAAIYSRDASQVASFGRTGQNGPTAALLGWAGSTYAVIARLDPAAHLGLVPATDSSTFIDLALTVADPCVDCIPSGLVLAGTIGIA